jgi:hypothetical protein
MPIMRAVFLILVFCCYADACLMRSSVILDIQETKMQRRSFIKGIIAFPSIRLLKNQGGYSEDGREISGFVSVDNEDFGIVIDGNGNEVEDCLSANLNNGDCTVFKRLADGSVGLSCFHGEWQAARKTVFRPLPMIFVRYKR